MKKAKKFSFPGLPRGKRCRRQDGFTLIELLVVVSMMALLASVSVLSLPGLKKAKQLANSGNMTVDLINQARQNAIAHDALTALVLVTDSSRPDLCNRVFVIEEYDAASNVWNQVSRWMTLPLGVLVDSGAATPLGTFVSNQPSLTTSISPLTYSGTRLSTLAYQVFLPDGRLLTTGMPSPVSPQLRLIEGIMKGSEIASTGAASSGTPSNYYDITINLYTGIPQADRP